MLLGQLFERFVDKTPFAVMARSLLERTLTPEALDALFEETADTQYTRELTFSSVVDKEPNDVGAPDLNSQILKLKNSGADTLFVFENYPAVADDHASHPDEVRLADIASDDATHYPLTLIAAPGERLRLRLGYRPDLFERDFLLLDLK